jgi:hypothetical protein
MDYGRENKPDICPVLGLKQKHNLKKKEIQQLLQDLKLFLKCVN